MNMPNSGKYLEWVVLMSAIFVIALGIGVAAGRAVTADTPGTEDQFKTSEDGDIPGMPGVESRTGTPVTGNDPGIAGKENMELVAVADLDRDGDEDEIYIDKSRMEDINDVTLRIIDSKGSEIWSESANTAHAGWNTLFLCEHEGGFYLLRYNPTMYQGCASYAYTLFTLEDGRQKVYRTNSLEFDINGTCELDVPKMIAFADDVNAYLGKSTLLMSTEGGSLCLGPSPAEPFLERYSWLDAFPYVYEADDDLGTRLVKYSEYAVSNRINSGDRT